MNRPTQTKKLEIWGRVQVEAARRRKADWKYNVGVYRACKNLRGQAFNTETVSRKSSTWVGPNSHVLLHG